jgi:hypothetical protein
MSKEKILLIEILPSHSKLPITFYCYWNISNRTCVFARIYTTKYEFATRCSIFVTKEKESHVTGLHSVTKHLRIQIEREDGLWNQTLRPHIEEKWFLATSCQTRIGKTENTIIPIIRHTVKRCTFSKWLIFDSNSADLNKIIIWQWCIYLMKNSSAFHINKLGKNWVVPLDECGLRLYN